MIMGKDRARLSKRHGATSVIAYADLGYLPEAVLNYIAKLGWGHGDQEVFSREELIAAFDLAGVSKNPAIFDTDKLNWLNGQYIRKILPERLFVLCEPLLLEAYNNHDLDYLKRVVNLFHDRLVLIKDIVPLSDFCFQEVAAYDPKGIEKHFKGPKARTILEALKTRLNDLAEWKKEEIEKIFKELAAELGVKLGVVIHPCRLALSGRSETPPMYDVVELLGREKVGQRLDQALKFISENFPNG
jgi:glutamyl-tRNA synthetase